jgi:hypothetical protein
MKSISPFINSIEHLLDLDSGNHKPNTDQKLPFTNRRKPFNRSLTVNNAPTDANDLIPSRNYSQNTNSSDNFSNFSLRESSNNNNDNNLTSDNFQFKSVRMKSKANKIDTKTGSSLRQNSLPKIDYSSVNRKLINYNEFFQTNSSTRNSISSILANNNSENINNTKIIRNSSGTYGGPNEHNYDNHDFFFTNDFYNSRTDDESSNSKYQRGYNSEIGKSPINCVKNVS